MVRIIHTTGAVLVVTKRQTRSAKATAIRDPPALTMVVFEICHASPVPGTEQAHLMPDGGGNVLQARGMDGITASTSGGCPVYSVLLRTGTMSMMPVMSEDLPRTINDYYARVTLQRHHIGNPPESDERIEVVVRIPEEVAKTLAGGRKPSVVIFEVGSRVRNVATETAGVPNDSSLVIAVVSTVDTVMPPSLPTESNFKDQDGAEGWIL